MLTGSLGMLPSASIGAGRPGPVRAGPRLGARHRRHRQGQPAGDVRVGGADAASRTRHGGRRQRHRIGHRPRARGRPANGRSWRRRHHRGRHEGRPLEPLKGGRAREHSGPHLAERGVRRLGGREGSRTHPRPALRHERVRGRARLRDLPRPGDLPPPRPPPADGELGQALLHGPALLQGADPRGHPRADRAQRLLQLLHPAADLPRPRADGARPRGQPRRGDDRRLGVGRLPGRGGQAHRRARQGVLVAADLAAVAAAALQGRRPVPQLGAGQDRVQAGRLRGGDPARRARPRVRGLGRERVRGQGRADRPRRARRPASSTASAASR